MPPLIVALAVGAGLYAGYKVARGVLAGMAEAREAAVAEAQTEAMARKRAGSPALKDLGALEFDETLGAYRPRRVG